MTFTALARSTDGAWIGVASATCTLAVGAIVPAVVAGVGAVATQAWTNRSFKQAGISALVQGAAPATVLSLFAATDERFDLRQVGLLGRDDRPAAHTGDATSPWSGHRLGEHHLAMGNLLVDEDVLLAVDEVLADGDRKGSVAGQKSAGLGGAENLAWRLTEALLAGDARGGDRRGRQSAVVQVARLDALPALAGDLAIDLRVDDDPRAPTRLAEILEQACGG